MKPPPIPPKKRHKVDWGNLDDDDYIADIRRREWLRSEAYKQRQELAEKYKRRQKSG